MLFGGAFVYHHALATNDIIRKISVKFAFAEAHGSWIDIMLRMSQWRWHVKESMIVDGHEPDDSTN